MAGVGCRTARPRPPLTTILPAPDALLADIAARRRAVTSLRGIAHISYESAEEKLGSRHAVVVAPPDRFRLEVLSPLGALAVVTANGHELAVWVRRERRTYRGPTTAASVGAYIGVPLSVADVVAVLLGLPPERRAIAPATVAFDDTAGLIRVHVPIEGGRQDTWYAGDSALPVASETTLADAAQILRVDFSDYRPIAGVAMPLDIDMRLDPAGRRVHVRYEPPTVNATVRDEVFTFPVQDKVEELRLDRYPADRDPIDRVPGSPS
jgi:hypothetical protein